MSLFERLFAGRPRDGAAPALEAVATGITPALMAAAEAELQPSTRLAAVPQAGWTVLDETLMAKVLHGWLQNRHQTLFPLAVNLKTLSAAQRQALAAFAAVALLADDAARAREAQVRGWFTASGAEADTMEGLAAALADPPAMSRAVAAVIAGDLAAYAYVVAVVALQARGSLLEYFAARLNLPPTLVRSAQRRYGG